MQGYTTSGADTAPAALSATLPQPMDMAGRQVPGSRETSPVLHTDRCAGHRYWESVAANDTEARLSEQEVDTAGQPVCTYECLFADGRVCRRGLGDPRRVGRAATPSGEHRENRPRGREVAPVSERHGCCARNSTAAARWNEWTMMQIELGRTLAVLRSRHIADREARLQAASMLESILGSPVAPARGRTAPRGRPKATGPVANR